MSGETHNHRPELALFKDGLSQAQGKRLREHQPTLEFALSSVVLVEVVAQVQGVKASVCKEKRTAEERTVK